MFVSSRRRPTRYSLVTWVQTCALPIYLAISRADRRRVVILIGADFYYRGAADRCRKSMRRPILRQSGAGIGVGVAIVDALVDRLHALQRPETRPIGR